MNESNSPAAPAQDPERNRWFPTLGDRKTWFVIFAGLLALITLTALFYGVENFRGKWAWSKAQRALLAKGEVLDIRRLVPPLPPENRNLAMAGPFRDLMAIRTNQAAYSNAVETVRLQIEFAKPVYQGLHPEGNNQQSREGLLRPELGSWPISRSIDWEEWAEYYRLGARQLTNHNFFPPSADALPAEAVLQALSGQEETYQTVRSATRRPEAQFPVAYENGFATLLPHLPHLHAISRYCSLKAGAHLAMGETEAAFDAIQTGLRLTEAIGKEPLIISQLVRYAMWHILMQPLSEGLRSHQWDDKHLEFFIEAISSINLIEDYQRALRGERALAAMELSNISRKNLQGLGGSFLSRDHWTGVWTDQAFVKLVPRGWIRQNLARMAIFYQDWIELPVEAAARRVKPEQAERVSQAVYAAIQEERPYTFIARMLMPRADSFARKMAAAQNGLHLATVAAHLEVHFKKEGRYPEDLNELTSAAKKALPHDIITGEPLRYEALPGRKSYRLYSVGWNATDDGGELPQRESRGKPAPNWEVGDWVWPRFEWDD